MKRVKKHLSNGEAADLLEQVAEKVAKLDPDFGIQLELNSIMFALARLEHIEGIGIVNRISMLQGQLSATAPPRYAIVQETLDSMQPLDPVDDAEALRSLAAEIRAMQH